MPGGTFLDTRYHENLQILSYRNGVKFSGTVQIKGNHGLVAVRADSESSKPKGADDQKIPSDKTEQYIEEASFVAFHHQAAFAEAINNTELRMVEQQQSNKIII